MLDVESVDTDPCQSNNIIQHDHTTVNLVEIFQPFHSGSTFKCNSMQVSDQFFLIIRQSFQPATKHREAFEQRGWRRKAS